MTPRKVLTPLIAAAACLTVLGVGLAAGDQPPRPSLVVPLPSPSPKVANLPTDLAPGRPGPGAVRAVTHEAEIILGLLTSTYVGDDSRSRWKLSVVGALAGDVVPPPRADEIRVLYRPNATPASSTELAFEGGKLARASVGVSGPLDQVLDGLLVRELHRVVMAERLGRPLPWWVDAACSPLGDVRRVRAADARCRAGLAAGGCLRLTSLFTLREAPTDAEVAAAQSSTVLRFLLTAAPVRHRAAADRRHQLLMSFVVHGGLEGWDAAAHLYAAADVAALEAAWVRWLDTEDSVVRPPPPPGATVPLPAPVDPLHMSPPRRGGPVPIPLVPPTIPPTRVRDQ